MIPCLFKEFLGVECLGCGIQRSTLFLIDGQFKDSFVQYPALLPLFIFGIYSVFQLFRKNKESKKQWWYFGLLTFGLILVSYYWKL